MSYHRKQRVTVGDLLAVRAYEMPSLVPQSSLTESIGESDRDLIGDDWDREARSDLRLLSDEELAEEQEPPIRISPKRRDDLIEGLFSAFHAGSDGHPWDASQIAGRSGNSSPIAADDRSLADPADPHLTETLDLSSGPGVEAPRRQTIYVASSWRNEHQPHVVEVLRAAGHQVYDFRHPTHGDSGFSWSGLTGPGYDDMVPPSFWTPADLAMALRHPVARRGHGLDQAALDAATACVLLLPCGSSAHLEAGYCAGRGVPTIVYAPSSIREPELMYLTFGDEPIVTTEADLLAWLDDLDPTAGDLGGES